MTQQYKELEGRLNNALPQNCFVFLCYLMFTAQLIIPTTFVVVE